MNITATTRTAFVAVLLLTACSKSRDAKSTAATITPTDAPTAAATSPTSLAASDTWDRLKNYTYDQRAEFASKTNDYAAKLDRDLVKVKGAASTRLAEARDDLRNAATDVNNATADTWNAAKDKVGRAWQKAEAAYQNAAE